MNERIKELAEQVGIKESLVVQFKGDTQAYVVQYDELEKFAELIVKETTDVIIKGHKGHMNPALAYDSVKQHFGVEE